MLSFASTDQWIFSYEQVFLVQAISGRAEDEAGGAIWIFLMQTLTTQLDQGFNEAAMESLVGNTGLGREQGGQGWAAGGEEKRREKVKVEAEVKSYVHVMLYNADIYVWLTGQLLHPP